MIFQKYLNDYINYLKIKKYSVRTQESYFQENKKFILFLEEHYPRLKNIAQITKDIILDYSNYITCYKDNKGKLLSGKTIKLKLIAVKQFFKYLAKSDYILKDPTVTIEIPRDERSLPRNVPTEKEVMMILESIKTDTPIGLRNKAIMELFYSCGIRTSELCNLKIHDVDLKEMTVIIKHGKGDKTRVLPLGQYCVEYIRLYLERARKFMLRGKTKDEGYLFLSQRGNPFSRDTINACVIRSVLRNVKLNKKITCYSMRHAVATHLIKNKVDIRYVSELLGHKSINTTQKYCHLEISDLKKMHALYHPREI